MHYFVKHAMPKYYPLEPRVNSRHNRNQKIEGEKGFCDNSLTLLTYSVYSDLIVLTISFIAFITNSGFSLIIS